jgi:hypothetical protein
MQKSAENILASIFWDQDGILLIGYLPTDLTINAEYYSSLLKQMKDFCRKNGEGMSPRLSFSCTTSHGSPGTCNLEETGLPEIPFS